MPISSDTKGRLSYWTAPTTGPAALIGSYFRRIEPQGDAADFVIFKGVVDVGTYDGAILEYAIFTAEFAAVPPADGDVWDGEDSSTTIAPGRFTSEYTLMSAAEVQAWAAAL